MSETILSSRVRLARNYADLPFAGLGGIIVKSLFKGHLREVAL